MTRKVVTFGEVLMRLTAPAFSRFSQANEFTAHFGGAEANVAVSLSRFGIPSAHVTCLPSHDLGTRVTSELRKHGVDTQYIQYGEGRLGLYFMENGAMQRSPQIIYDRFDSAFANLDASSFDWENILKDASWFHYTGITPALSQQAADACLQALQSARKLGVTISGDINYRRNLWQYGKSAQDIMPELVALTDVVVAGITDMENCCGISGKDYEDACAKMKKKYPVIRIITTTVRETLSANHNKLSAMLWNGKLLQSKTYDITSIVDRIGAGDAFMAGLIYAKLNNRDDQQALEFATGAGAWKHSVEGDVNIATAAEIDMLVKGELTGKLLR